MFPTPVEKEQFDQNPAQFLEKAVRDYLAFSPNNHFTAFPEDPIWDEPLVGFASGDDPIFREYKTIIGDFHVTPREALEKYVDAAGCFDKNSLKNVSVISYILPATEKTRVSNRTETAVCSVKWNHTRFEGQETNARLSRYLVALIESLGRIAVAPELARWWEVVRQPGGMASNWSQRHIAYAAGLGTFSLSDGFITPKGVAIRAGSVVCNLALPPTARTYADHYANCLFHSQGICKKCAARCPAGAISEKGHDKIKCGAYLNEMREVAKRLGRTEGYIGRAYLGCGFCQTGVPCEERIPLKE